MSEIQDFSVARQRMVDEQIRARGISDTGVLTAMARVPREAFLPEHLHDRAYGDHPLPIDHDQTMSQPFIVASMIAALELRGDERVLEIGTGSGYGAAVLGECADAVFTIERHAALAGRAGRTLELLRYDRVRVHIGDGSCGLSSEAPFDAIVVTAAGPEVPVPLIDQMAAHGRLVMPVGERDGHQTLIRLRRVGDAAPEREELAPVRFVPLIGEEAWHEG